VRHFAWLNERLKALIELEPPDPRRLAQELSDGFDRSLIVSITNSLPLACQSLRRIIAPGGG
jgi:hypothetical protein